MRLKRPYERVKHLSRNQSARLPHRITLIVIHSTEGQNLPGVTDLRNLGSWFDNPAAQASCHVGVDAEGNSALYVQDKRKAWHCASFNSVSLGIELVGKMAQKSWPSEQEKKAAKYVAYWSQRHRIPIRKAKVDPNFGTVKRAGVITHAELGVAGGNHGDPGKGFKMGRLLWLARGYRVRGW